MEAYCGFEPEKLYYAAIVFWSIIIFLVLLQGFFSQNLYLRLKKINLLNFSSFISVHDIIFFQIGGISLVVFLFSRIIYASNIRVESCSGTYFLMLLPAIQIILAIMLVYVALSMYIHLAVSLARNKISTSCYWTIVIISISVLGLFMKLELDSGLVL